MCASDGLSNVHEISGDPIRADEHAHGHRYVDVETQVHHQHQHGSRVRTPSSDGGEKLLLTVGHHQICERFRH